MTTPDDVDALAASLDDPVAGALRGRHAHLARHRGEAVSYDADVAVFSAGPTTAAGWDDLAGLVGSGEVAELFSSSATPPDDWEGLFTLPGLQYVAGPHLALPCTTPAGTETVVLGAADVPEMLALTALTRPGPFWSRTVEMGTYLGVRDADRRLLAMTGERMRPPGATEISAVCTHPDARGRGLAGHLVSLVAAGIRDRGELPFLHVIASNHGARALYDSLGFVVRREVAFRGYRVPRRTPADPAGSR